MTYKNSVSCTPRRIVTLSPLFVTLVVTFCVCLIMANLVENKIVALGPISLTAGFAVFPISYIITDCLVEVYGFRKARFVIWLGFGANLLVTLLLQLGILLPELTSGMTRRPWRASTGLFPAYLLPVLRLSFAAR